MRFIEAFLEFASTSFILDRRVGLYRYTVWYFVQRYRRVEVRELLGYIP